MAASSRRKARIARQKPVVRRSSWAQNEVSTRRAAHGRPPEAMNGCFVDAEREGSGLLVWRLRSEPTGSYESGVPIEERRSGRLALAHLIGNRAALPATHRPGIHLTLMTGGSGAFCLDLWMTAYQHKSIASIGLRTATSPSCSAGVSIIVLATPECPSRGHAATIPLDGDQPITSGHAVWNH